jgi:hypothetical protein
MVETLMENAMQQTLEEAGYRADYHMVPAICNRGLVRNCAGIPGSDSRQLVPRLLDFAIFRAVPTFAKPNVYNEGDWLLRPRLQRNASPHRRTMAGIGLISLEGLIDSVRVADVPPRFKFYQTLVTHSPFTIDEYCQPVTEPQPLIFETITAQTVCALKRLNSLLGRLKQLGVYDNTTIVFASDHGHKLPLPEQEPALMARGIVPEHHSRAMAVLMVKPRTSRGGVEFSAYPASLADIPDTILGDIELPALGRGINLLAVANKAPPRRREYYHLDKLLNVAQEPEILAHYAIDGEHSSADSWSRLDRHTPEDLACDTLSAFNTEELETHIFPIGFSIIESFGRWTDGDNAALVFTPEPGCSAQALHFNVKGHVADMESELRVAVFLNDAALGEMSFRRMDPYRDVSYPIPAGLLKTGETNVVRFAIEGASSMLPYGRRMGLGIVSMVLQGGKDRLE